MSVRRALRVKVVLPVTVFRNREKQLAHTLDATSNSAKLGSLHLQLDPGEVVEIQRNASRAKFQVHWVGAPGSLLTGQAGVRALEGSKTIWTPDFPRDEPDLNCDPQHLRSNLPLVRSIHQRQTQPHARHEFRGGASVRATGYSHAIYAQILDVCENGAHLKTPFVLPASTELYVLLNIEGFVVEVPGIVRASDPHQGLQIDFQKMSTTTKEKLALGLRLVQQPSSATTPEFAENAQLAI